MADLWSWLAPVALFLICLGAMLGTLRAYRARGAEPAETPTRPIPQSTIVLVAVFMAVLVFAASRTQGDGSAVAGSLLMAAFGFAAALIGVALVANHRNARSRLAAEYNRVTGLPISTLELPLRLLGAGLSALGALIAVLAIVNAL